MTQESEHSTEVNKLSLVYSRVFHQTGRNVFNVGFFSFLIIFITRHNAIPYNISNNYIASTCEV